MWNIIKNIKFLQNELKRRDGRINLRSNDIGFGGFSSAVKESGTGTGNETEALMRKSRFSIRNQKHEDLLNNMRKNKVKEDEELEYFLKKGKDYKGDDSSSFMSMDKYYAPERDKDGNIKKEIDFAKFKSLSPEKITIESNQNKIKDNIISTISNKNQMIDALMSPKRRKQKGNKDINALDEGEDQKYKLEKLHDKNMQQRKKREQKIEQIKHLNILEDEGKEKDYKQDIDFEEYKFNCNLFIKDNISKYILKRKNFKFKQNDDDILEEDVIYETGKIFEMNGRDAVKADHQRRKIMEDNNYRMLISTQMKVESISKRTKTDGKTSTTSYRLSSRESGRNTARSRNKYLIKERKHTEIEEEENKTLSFSSSEESIINADKAKVERKKKAMEKNEKKKNM